MWDTNNGKTHEHFPRKFSRLEPNAENQEHMILEVAAANQIKQEKGHRAGGTIRIIFKK